MKKRFLTIVCVGIMCCVSLAGCNSQAQGDNGAGTAVSQSVEGSQEAGKEDVRESSRETTGQSRETASAQTPEQSGAADSVAITLEDGVYTAKFDTDSSMFRVNETQDGLGTLTVKDGRMTIHISLMSKKILNLYPGLAADAQKDGAALLQPTTDTVTYSDGLSEEVYGFDIPVPVVGQEFDVALVGEKGTWYDHKVSVSDPVKAE